MQLKANKVLSASPLERAPRGGWKMSIDCSRFSPALDDMQGDAGSFMFVLLGRICHFYSMHHSKEWFSNPSQVK